MRKKTEEQDSEKFCKECAAELPSNNKRNICNSCRNKHSEKLLQALGAAAPVVVAATWFAKRLKK